VKTALVFGSTGLVGGNVLNQLIQNNNYSKIKIFVRSSIQVNNSKVQVIQTDFNNLEKYKEEIAGDECFYCIGTTKKNSPDKNEYQKIELDIPKKVAQIAKSNNINSFFFVSSGYANSKSSGDYLKYKGLVEEEILGLGFFKIGIMRPSFILGKRKEFRLGEKIGIIIFKLLNPIFIGPLKKMRSIHSETIARAMIKIANEDIDRKIFESDQISELVK
tara:strand:- start:326 stop:979 length:654 start_codon:yes stop_codon:yes gene_type:complete